jgi:hypothetical protein
MMPHFVRAITRWGASSKCRSGRSNRSKHGGRLPRLQSYREPLSAAGAVGAADRTRVGDQAHPLGRRTTRQNDGGRTPKGSAERHLRVRSLSASTLGVGRWTRESDARCSRLRPTK